MSRLATLARAFVCYRSFMAGAAVGAWGMLLLMVAMYSFPPLLKAVLTKAFSVLGGQ